MLVFLISADIAGIGRFDVENLSNQTRLELLVAHLSNVEKLKTPDGDFLPIEEWEKAIEFSDDGDVSAINLKKMAVDGNLCIQYLPKALKELTVSYMVLKGGFSTHLLPRTLEKLDISENQMEGTFSVAGLPRSAGEITLETNYFTGSLDLTALPATLRKFDASFNEFSGELDLTKLPPVLERLNVSSNAFKGKIRIENVPETTSAIRLNLNNFDVGNACIDMGPNLWVELDADHRDKVFRKDGKVLTSVRILFIGRARNYYY